MRGHKRLKRLKRSLRDRRPSLPKNPFALLAVCGAAALLDSAAAPSADGHETLGVFRRRS